MILAGIIMGLLFLPLSLYFLNIDSHKVYSFSYILICIISGIFVGLASFFVTRITILREINKLSNKIGNVTNDIINYEKGTIQDVNACKNCYINIKSKDMLGEIAGKYNTLVQIIRSFFWSHERSNDFFAILNKSLKINELDKNIINFICSITNAIAAEIYHLDKNDELKVGYAKGVHTLLSNNKAQSIKSIIEDGRLISLKNYRVEPIEFGTGTIKPAEVLYFPMQYGNIGIGVLVLYLDTYITKEKRDFIEYVLLNNYSLAYQNSISYEKMQNIAALMNSQAYITENSAWKESKRSMNAQKEQIHAYVLLCLI